MSIKLDTVGDRAKFARIAAGLSLGQASSISRLRKQWLEMLEEGEVTITPDTGRELAGIYEVSTDWLLFGIARELDEDENATINKLNGERDRDHLRALLQSMDIEVKPKKEIAPIISGD